MAGLPKATEGILQALAQAVALHRRRGGTLATLPEQQRNLLQAMDGAQRRFFMDELARADAEEGRDRFRAKLGQMRAKQGDASPGEGTP